MAIREILAHFGVSFDTKQLEHGENKIDAMVGQLKHFGHALAGAFLFHEVEGFVKTTVDAAQNLDRMAATLGLTTDELQKYQHAADMVDVSTEMINTGFRFLQRNAFAAANGSKQVGTIFRDLGIELKDSSGHIRPTTELFDDVAERIRSLEDPAAQTALAMKIFGRSGASLLPLLKTGAKGIEEFKDQVDELGGGFKEDFLKLADQFDKHEKKLAMLKRSLSATLAGVAIPALMWLGHWVEKAGLAIIKFNRNGQLTQVILEGFAILALTKLPAVIALVKHLGLQTALAAGKWLLMFAAIDDLITWFRGGESAIGDFFGLFDEEINKSAAIFGDSVVEMFTSWENFKAGLLAGAKTLAFGIIVAFNEVGNAFAMIMAGIADLWDRTLQSMHLPSWMQDMLGGDATNTDFAKNRRQTQRENQESREQLGSWFEKSLSSDENVKKLKDAIQARKDKAQQERDLQGANDAAEKGAIYRNEKGTFVLPEQTVSMATEGKNVHNELTDNSKTEITVNVPGGTTGDMAKRTANAVARATRNDSNGLLFAGETVLE